jgi:hypothetical protein
MNDLQPADGLSNRANIILRYGWENFQRSSAANDRFWHEAAVKKCPILRRAGRSRSEILAVPEG